MWVSRDWHFQAEAADHDVTTTQGLEGECDAVFSDEDPQPPAAVGLAFEEDEHLPGGLVCVQVGTGCVVVTDRVCKC